MCWLHLSTFQSLCAIHASHFCQNKNSTSLWVSEWLGTACHVALLYAVVWLPLTFNNPTSRVSKTHMTWSLWQAAAHTQKEIRKLSWSTNASCEFLQANYIEQKTRSNWVCTAVAIQQLQQLSPLGTPHETAGPWVLGSRWWQLGPVPWAVFVTPLVVRDSGYKDSKPQRVFGCFLGCVKDFYGSPKHPPQKKKHLVGLAASSRDQAEEDKRTMQVRKPMKPTAFCLGTTPQKQVEMAFNTHVKVLQDVYLLSLLLQNSDALCFP